MALDLDFQGKRVLVTAGTKGVGKAVVGLLKQLGATVLTTARHVPTESVADAFVAAVGAFTDQMAELSPPFCHHVAAHGQIVLDSDDARHEAGDLLQAGLDADAFPTLGQLVRRGFAAPAGPVLFKSCGWAGWDLAAARLAMRQHAAGATHVNAPTAP